MSKDLAALFNHHLWANLRVLDACTDLEEAQLDSRAEGTYGAIRDTLVHLLAAEGRYVNFLLGKPDDKRRREKEPFPGMESLCTQATENGAALIGIAESATEADSIEGEEDGVKFSLPIMIVLTQAIHHATEHRTQINTTLTQAGLAPIDTSSWAWGEATGQAGV